MESTKKLAIVISSKSTAKEKERFIQMIQSTCGYESKLSFVYNPNGESLTSIYNKALTSIDADYFIFMHDDIGFYQIGWGAEIVRLFEENKDYGIIGVAGSGEFDSKAAWWQYKDIYGRLK